VTSGVARPAQCPLERRGIGKLPLVQRPAPEHVTDVAHGDMGEERLASERAIAVRADHQIELARRPVAQLDGYSPAVTLTHRRDLAAGVIGPLGHPPPEVVVQDAPVEKRDVAALLPEDVAVALLPLLQDQVGEAVNLQVGDVVIDELVADEGLQERRGEPDSRAAVDGLPFASLENGDGAPGPRELCRHGTTGDRAAQDPHVQAWHRCMMNHGGRGESRVGRVRASVS
jgi:hypothetical protein